MKTGAKVAVALGAAVLAVGAPVAFVVYGAGAPGRADSSELWWERVRRAPAPVLASPERASAVQAGGIPVRTVVPKVTVEETRVLPVRSPVVAIATYGEGHGDRVAVATFDDGVFLMETDGTVHRVGGVQAVNALAFDAFEVLVIASDDGAFVVERGEWTAHKVASGAFSAATVMDGVWLVGRGGLVRLGVHAHSITRWGPDQGVRLSQPSSIARCGEHDLCVGTVEGLRKFRVAPMPEEPYSCDPEGCKPTVGTSAPGHLSEVAVKAVLPEPFVTAVARDDQPGSPKITWAATFDGGLARVGAPPLTPADGLPEGRVNPRALAAYNGEVYAGTPSGLLVAIDAQVFAGTDYATLVPKGRTAALVPVGGEVTAVTFGGRGLWIGLPGKIVRMSVQFPSELSALAQSRNP